MIDINNELLTKIIEKHLENDKELVNIVLDIVNKINNLPFGTETSIAQLIDYNPEISFTEPLTQGKVSYCVQKVCKEINILLEKTDKSFGGLAYFATFKKVGQIKKENNFETKSQDFCLNLAGGVVLPNSDGYNIIINKNTQSVDYDGNSYKFTSEKFIKIKKLTNRYLIKLIKIAKVQTFEYLCNNVCDGVSENIKINVGGLFVNINCTACYRNIISYKYCQNFRKKCIKIIIK